MPRPRNYLVHTVEDYRAVDLADLRRWKMLDGKPRVITWTCDGEFTGFTGVIAHARGVELYYVLQPTSAEAAPRMAREYVGFAQTRTPFNGSRLWFCCPTCGRPCRVLYGVGLSAVRARDVVGPTVRGLGNFKCRRCRGLQYASQYTNPHFRLMHRIEKQRLRLGGRASIDGEFPAKPRTMHWRKYLTLRRRDAAMKEQLGASFEAFVGAMRRSIGGATR